MSADMAVISRQVYTTFMLLGDVGGFSGLLYATGSVLLGLFRYNNSENILVQALYAKSPSEDDVMQESNELDPSQ